jgi:hypothetical protein
MLHVTLLRLSASSTTLIPLPLSRSYFARDLPQVVLVPAVSIPSTVFHGPLASALRVDCESFSSEVFASQRTISERTGSFYFTSCLFANCKSSSNGAAIQMGSSILTSARLRIAKTGFLRCSSDKRGGAIYAQSADFDVSKSCFDRCAAGTFPAFTERSSQSCTVADVWATDMTDQDGSDDSDSIASVDCHCARVRSVNFSNIARADAAVLMSSGDLLQLQDGYFGCCRTDSVIHIWGGADPLKGIYFIKNKAAVALVRVVADVPPFQSCAFVADDSKCIINKRTTFRECLFGDRYRPARFPESCITIGCSFSVGSVTHDLEIYESGVCWALVATPKAPTVAAQDPPVAPPGKKSSSAVVFAVAVIVISAVVVAVVGSRWWKGRIDTGALLRVYAQV